MPFLSKLFNRSDSTTVPKAPVIIPSDDAASRMAPIRRSMTEPVAEPDSSSEDESNDNDSA